MDCHKTPLKHILLRGVFMAKQKRIQKAFEKSLHISMEDHSKIVIMSDCHRSTGTWADSFIHNRPIYTAALKYYYLSKFTYIELGDGDELWEARRFSDVYNTHREIYQLLHQFHKENRLYLLFGNHDRIKENNALIWKGLNATIPFYESIVLHHSGSLPIYMFHGYQGDLINDRFWKLSRFLVRYLWKPLELRGFKDPTSAAKNYTKIRRMEEAFITFSCRNKCILTAGHTHKPTLMKTDCGMYFNSGSCIHPEAVTAIEIEKGKASLVKWSICSYDDMSLHVCREILKELFI